MKYSDECLDCEKKRNDKTLMQCLKKEKKNFNQEDMELRQENISMIEDYTKNITNLEKDTPPEIEAEIFKKLIERTKNLNPYGTRTKNANTSCLYYINAIKNYAWRHKNNKEAIKEAAYFSVFANIIDYNISSYDDNIYDIYQSLLRNEKDFDIHQNYDFRDRFYVRLTELNKNKGTLLTVLDNAGEVVFNIILLMIIKQLFPNINQKIVVRGGYIFNDVTIDDIVQIANESCEINSFFSDIVGYNKDYFKTGNIISSKITEYIDKIKDHIFSTGKAMPGMPKPSYCESNTAKCSQFYQAVNADNTVVFSIGQGNFETVSYYDEPEIFVAFRAKCDVVKGYLDVKLGDGLFFHKEKNVSLNDVVLKCKNMKNYLS